HVERRVGRTAKSDGVEPVAERGVIAFGKPAPKALHDGAQAKTARIEALHRVAAHYSACVHKFENALAQRIGRNRAGDWRRLRQTPALIVGEEESLIAPHRTAHCAAESIVPQPL